MTSLINYVTIIEQVNVGGVKNLIEIAKKKNARQVQISTLSVAGENIDDKFTIIFSNYIHSHNGSINMIEINEKIGVVLTGGDDNRLCIRKLYDFELLTCIKLKSKFI